MIRLCMIVSLFVLASCNDNIYRSQSCKYNDQNVNCSALEAYLSGASAAVISEIKSEITVDYQKKEMEILENTRDVKTFKNKAGSELECKASTTAGQVIGFSVGQKILTLKYKGGTTVYQRQGSKLPGVNGTWSISHTSDNVDFTETLTISGDTSLSFKVKCQALAL